MFWPYIRHAWIWLFIFFVFRYNQEMTAAHRDVHRINWAFEGRRWPCYWKIKKRIINRTHTEKFNSTYEIENIDRKIVYVSFAHSNACDVMSVAAACSMSQSTCCTAARIHCLSLCVCAWFSRQIIVSLSLNAEKLMTIINLHLIQLRVRGSDALKHNWIHNVVAKMIAVRQCSRHSLIRLQCRVFVRLG